MGRESTQSWLHTNVMYCLSYENEEQFSPVVPRMIKLRGLSLPCSYYHWHLWSKHARVSSARLKYAGIITSSQKHCFLLIFNFKRNKSSDHQASRYKKYLKDSNIAHPNITFPSPFTRKHISPSWQPFIQMRRRKTH